mmetsp:Transcript_26616/g.82317  ORF Transcript_26616/g.82317 Transcript_26616/m.82317 type:complete len:305 (-) Transcript_26616:13-927(-)
MLRSDTLAELQHDRDAVDGPCQAVRPLREDGARRQEVRGRLHLQGEVHVGRPRQRAKGDGDRPAHGDDDRRRGGRMHADGRPNAQPVPHRPPAARRGRRDRVDAGVGGPELNAACRRDHRFIVRLLRSRRLNTIAARPGGGSRLGALGPSTALGRRICRAVRACGATTRALVVAVRRGLRRVDQVGFDLRDRRDSEPHQRRRRPEAHRDGVNDAAEKIRVDAAQRRLQRRRGQRADLRGRQRAPGPRQLRAEGPAQEEEADAATQDAVPREGHRLVRDRVLHHEHVQPAGLLQHRRSGACTPHQ